MLTKFKYELDAGLPSFRGTQVAAEIPIRQRVFTEILARMTTIARVEFQDSDVVLARVFGISFKARIVRVELPLKVVLGVSYWMRLALWPLESRLPFVTAEGTTVTIDLAAVVAAKYPEYAQIISHVRLLQLSTTPGLLLATFEFMVV